MKQTFLIFSLIFFFSYNSFGQNCAECIAGSVNVTGSTNLTEQNTPMNYCITGSWTGSINPVLANGSVITICPSATWTMPSNQTLQNNITVNNYGTITDGSSNYNLFIGGQVKLYNEPTGTINIFFFENQEGVFENEGTLTVNSTYLHGKVVNTGTINVTAACNGGVATTSCGFYVGNKSIDLYNSGVINMVDGTILDGMIGGTGIVNSTGTFILSNNGDNTLNTYNLNNLVLQNTNTLQNGTFKISGNLQCNTSQNNASVCLYAGATNNCPLNGNAVGMCTPLPISLVSFAKRIVNEEVIFLWESGEEINSDQYELQMSVDGKNFTTIEKVKSTGSNSYYQSASIRQSTEIAYYRLKALDYDGNFQIFEIISHSAKPNANNRNDILIYPNHLLTGSQLNIKFPNLETYVVSIFDFTGKRLFLKTISDSEIVSIPLSNNFVKGEYILEAVSIYSTSRKKFIISN